MAMAGFKDYVDRNSPFLPFGIGLLLFGGVWTGAAIAINEPWSIGLLIAGIVILATSIPCLILGIRSNLKARRKK